MATAPGTRVVVGDPLAFNARETLPERSLAQTGIRNPNQGPGQAAARERQGFQSAVGRLMEAAGGVLADKKDEMITEGKLDYARGKTEQEVLAQGNMYRTQGYQTLQAADAANVFLARETQKLEDETSRMSEDEYKQYITKARADQLKNLPDDPAVRKVYAAAFDDVGTRLTAAHVKQHSAYNQREQVNAGVNFIRSGSRTNADATSLDPETNLRLSASTVSRVYTPSDRDRDIGIRTILGEAASESDEGMAAVAHVLKNRQGDARWGGTIASVALAPKQFSAWNKGAGGNNPEKWDVNSDAYRRAGKIFDAVMAGHHVDPTGGATHYYSPAGMSKLVADGDQSNLIPDWLADESKASGGEVRIGGHRFVGRARAMAADRGSPAIEVVARPGASPQAVADAAGVPTQSRPDRTQLQEFLESDAYSPAVKVESLYRAVIADLNEGNDQSFNDAGGIATFYKLGATPEQISQVSKARERFEDAKDKEFDVNDIKYQNDITEQVKNGRPLNDALDEINARWKQGQFTSSFAKSLANKVSADYAAQGKKSQMSNPEYRTEIATLYNRVLDQTLDPVEAARRAKSVAERYGANEADVNADVTSMFSAHQRYLDNQRTKNEAAAKKFADDKVTKDQVDKYVAQGWGLSQATGKITVNNRTGQPVEVTAQQYGINGIKAREAAAAEAEIKKATAQSGIQSDDSVRAAAYARADERIYSQLKAQGVVDEEMSAYITGALSSNILDANGNINDGARRALDFYMRMSESATVGSEYMAKMVPDSKTRSLIETAKLFYDGRDTLDSALLKAHQKMNEPNTDVNIRLTQDNAFGNQVKAGVDKAINELVGRNAPVWPVPRNITLGDEAQVRKFTTPAKNYIEARAHAYHLEHPQEDPKVSIKKATDDLVNDSVIVGGNMLIGKSQNNARIDQVMGIEAFGKDKVQEIINQHVMENAPNEWPDLWKQRLKEQGSLIGNLSNMLAGVSSSSIVTPAYYAQWNPANGVLEVTPWKDESRTELMPVMPMQIRVKALGAKFIEEQKKPSVISNVWDKVLDATAGIAGNIGKDLSVNPADAWRNK